MRSSSVSTSSGSTASFAMVTRLHALIARDLDADRAAAGRAGDHGRGELFLGLRHFGLHFFDLLHELCLFHRSGIRSLR